MCYDCLSSMYDAFIGSDVPLDYMLLCASLGYLCISKKIALSGNGLFGECECKNIFTFDVVYFNIFSVYCVCV